MTRREARRKLGSRTSRRAGGNGKVMPGQTSSGKTRKICWRNPRHSKHLGWMVEAILGQGA